MFFGPSSLSQGRWGLFGLRFSYCEREERNSSGKIRSIAEYMFPFLPFSWFSFARSTLMFESQATSKMLAQTGYSPSVRGNSRICKLGLWCAVRLRLREMGGVVISWHGETELTVARN